MIKYQNSIFNHCFQIEHHLQSQKHRISYSNIKNIKDHDR
jgi:hypothetical protein